MLVFVTAYVLFVLSLVSCEDLTQRDGHGKPFGFGRPFQLVDELDSFPDPKTFYEDYIAAYKPVKIRNGAKVSKAFMKWTDDYFLTLNEPKDHTVSVETKKKEDRRQHVESMPFVEFVRQYNTTGIYMVNPVPFFIGDDVTLPCSLQCKDIIKSTLVENIMWFSSGGTKSVVHTDSVDNFNCLYRGEKTFVMVDPTKYGDKVDMDHPEGSYSGIDVDYMDYTKYPDLADVEYYHVNLTAGDCLYLPYKWIHQVRSYNSNIAVNVWWDHYKNKEVDWNNCNKECDPTVTFMRIQFNGFDSAMDNIEHIKDHIVGLLKNPQQMDVPNFIYAIIGRDVEYLKQEGRYDDATSLLAEMFTILDTDKDSILTVEEVTLAPDEAWTESREIMLELGHIIDGQPNDDKGPHDEL